MSGFCDSAHAKFCAESATLRRIEENLPNGAENVKILLIFVNPFKLQRLQITQFTIVMRYTNTRLLLLLLLLLVINFFYPQSARLYLQH